MADNLFTKLKHLYSGGIIIRNIKNDSLKVMDPYNTQALQGITTNYLQRSLNGIYSSMGSYRNNGYNTGAQLQRTMLFNDYELMDSDPIIASALDLLAEETTSRDEFGNILSITTKNQKIKTILENFYYDVLNIESNLYHWVRNLAKYGDWYLKLDIADGIGIVGVHPISTYTILRDEKIFERNENSIKFIVSDASPLKGTYESYEISHMRLINDSNYLPYGKSMVEAARKIWKQLSIMEDAMLIHRIMRAPQKRIFKVDIGNINHDEAETFIQGFINKIKKVPFVDQATGDYNLYYNMENLTEDFYLPVRGNDSGTSIDTLSGLEYNSIEDIEYLRNKMMSALRIPKAFLGYDETITGKSVLASEDIRFVKTIERLQRSVEHELLNLGIIHLYAQGYELSDLYDINISLTKPSTIYEQEKLEIWEKKLSLASSAQDLKYISSDWIYKNIFNMSEEEMKTERKYVVEDIKRVYRYSQIENEGNDPATTSQHVTDGGDVRGVNDPDDVDYESDDSNTSDDNEESKTKNPSTQTWKTDASPFGRDPIGTKGTKDRSVDKTTGRDFKGGSPLSRESLNKMKKSLKTNKSIKDLLS